MSGPAYAPNDPVLVRYLLTEEQIEGRGQLAVMQPLVYQVGQSALVQAHCPPGGRPGGREDPGGPAQGGPQGGPVGGQVREGLAAGGLALAQGEDVLQGIPVLVHTLGAAANKAAALVSVAKAAQAAGLTGTGGGANPMMFYEIVCAEPWAIDQPAALSDQRGSFYYQRALESAQWDQYVCPLIPRSAAAVGSQQLTTSRAPVLAFSGEADPQDPPPNMAGAQQYWPASRDIALPAQGHSYTDANGWLCESALIQAFIAQASVAHLDTSCLAAIPAPVFPATLQALAGSG